MEKKMVPEGEALGYILYVPKNKPTEDLPLLVYLHGAGERGTNLEHLYRHGIPKMIEVGRTYDAIVLCPQCPATAVWDNVVQRVKYTIDQVVVQYGVQKDRILCTGSSMGGFGTFMMGLTYRNFFAGIAPISGGAMSWRVGNLRSTPVYMAHGAEDSVVPITYSLMVAEELKKRDIPHKMLIVEGYGHNDAIDKVYQDGEVVNWLLKQRRTDFSYVPETLEEIF